MAGGRRRKSKKTRKMKGGMAYGFGAPITVGGLAVEPVNTSLPMKPDGTVNAEYAAADTATNATGGGRRRSRASRKGGKKTRKTKKAGRRHRKMKGGAGVYNAGAVGYGYSGPQQGVIGGIAPAAGYAAKVGGYGPTAGADGVMKV